MADDIRTQQIEKRIDREVAGGMLPAPTGGGFNLVPKDMAQAMEFGKLMAVSGECVRPAFRNNAGACLAIALQAWRDGGDPFAYANHAYIVGGQIAYEAKLVHAIVNTRAPTVGRLRTSYSGDGAKRRCKVIGYLRGEDEPFEYESPEVGTIKIKNSPLWQADPDQQLHYFSVRSWARRHVPEVLLGIYTPDEARSEVIDITPTHSAIQEHAAPVNIGPPIPWEVTGATGEVYEFDTVEKAVEACRRILVASAADTAALATAWENNAEFFLSLGQEGYETEQAMLERLHAELATRINQARGDDAPERTPAGASNERERTPQDELGGQPEALMPPAGERIIPEINRPWEGAGEAGKSRSEPADLLGDPPAENLFVPFLTNPGPAFFARQMLSMIAEKPGDRSRLARIKMTNEGGIKKLGAASVGNRDILEQYDAVMRALKGNG